MMNVTRRLAPRDGDHLASGGIADQRLFGAAVEGCFGRCTQGAGRDGAWPDGERREGRVGSVRRHRDPGSGHESATARHHRARSHAQARVRRAASPRGMVITSLFGAASKIPAPGDVPNGEQGVGRVGRPRPWELGFVLAVGVRSGNNGIEVWRARRRVCETDGLGIECARQSGVSGVREECATCVCGCRV